MKTVLSKVVLLAILTSVPLGLQAEPEIKGSPSELASYLASLPGTVQIVGEGEIKTPADRAIVSLRIDNENKSLAETIKLNHEVRAKLGEFLKEQGIKAEAVKPAPFSTTQRQAIFSDKVKSHKVNTLVKVETHNEQEFQSVTKAVDQFKEVAYVGVEFEHSEKDSLKAKASAKACEDAERQKAIYEEKLNVKLVPKNIADAKLPSVAMPSRAYGSYGSKASESQYTAGLRDVSYAPSAIHALAQREDTGEATPFGELQFKAQVVVEYSVQQK